MAQAAHAYITPRFRRQRRSPAALARLQKAVRRSAADLLDELALHLVPVGMAGGDVVFAGALPARLADRLAALGAELDGIEPDADDEDGTDQENAHAEGDAEDLLGWAEWDLFGVHAGFGDNGGDLETDGPAEELLPVVTLEVRHAA